MRTGAEYRESWRDGRNVWVTGEGLVADVIPEGINFREISSVREIPAKIWPTFGQQGV